MQPFTSGSISKATKAGKHTDFQIGPHLGRPSFLQRRCTSGGEEEEVEVKGSISQVVHSGAVTFCDLYVYWLRPRPVALVLGGGVVHGACKVLGAWRLDRASAGWESGRRPFNLASCNTRGEFRPLRVNRSLYPNHVLGSLASCVHGGNRGKREKGKGKRGSCEG
jgi:hypothetical protein